MQPDRSAELSTLLQRRLLILDGAMWTMVQRHGLKEADYRGARIAGHTHDLSATTTFCCSRGPTLSTATILPPAPIFSKGTRLIRRRFRKLITRSKKSSAS